MHRKHLFPFIAFLITFVGLQAFPETLPDTGVLTWQGDLAARMVAGIDAYLMRETEKTVNARAVRWSRDFTSHENYIQSIESNREHFRRIIGVRDQRDSVSMTRVSQLRAADNDSALPDSCLIGQSDVFKVYHVRWNVFDNVEGEGLLLEPVKEAQANVIALPDCAVPIDALFAQPGQSDFLQKVIQSADRGCRVLISALVDRNADYSGVPGIRMTNQPHREFLYRAAYEMGRHIIGYEVQKTLAAADWFKREWPRLPVGVMGEGEGGLIAFYSAASDIGIDTALIEGYFQPRETLWREPIYRNVWSLLAEFGDAEIASLIAPRPLIVDPNGYPEIDGPPQIANLSGAAPGQLKAPAIEDVQSEIQRAKKLTERLELPASIVLEPDRDKALHAFLESMKVSFSQKEPSPLTVNGNKPIDAKAVVKRQFDRILEHTQHLMRESEFTRTDFWAKADATNVESWQAGCEWYRNYFWDEVVGRLPEPTLPLNPRTRLVYDEPEYKGYEVALDIYPDVFAYGILLVPKDIEQGEQRPVIVCQHGLEGRPQNVADPNVEHRAYHRYACELAKRGFITYAPQNPYIGEDAFRVLLRKAQPLKLTLFSFIARQHQQTLNWLAQLPFADRERIAFYGLSYGGKTAMRIPALLDGYCLSICSADYNEWIWKNVSARHRYSYLLTGEYDMPEFDMGDTFNYAELSWLICPRPFMVERGHHDGVAPDEWVAYEYAKTKRRYVLLGIGDRTEIEFFNGPHSIHGVGTFDFLHRHLNWPKKQ